MATEKFTIEWVSSNSGKYRVRTYAEGASETFKKGSIVVYDDSEDGVVQPPLTAGVPDAVLMLGIALQDASGTAGTDIDVLIPTDEDVFSAVLASDQDTLVAPGQDSSTGELYGIIKLSTTAGAGTEWGLYTGATTWVKLLQWDPRDLARRGGAVGSFAAGDRVLFRFIGAAIDSAGHQA